MLPPPVFYPPRNFAAVPEAYTALDSARVVILPVPYDATTAARGQSRLGPMAIIDASQELELYDQELDAEPYTVGIHTLTELEPVYSGPEAMLERVATVAESFTDRLLVMLGGEHSLTVGAVRGLARRHAALSVLHLDAHADLRDSYLGTPYSHACVVRRLVESVPVTSVGIRSLSAEEAVFARERGLRLFYAAESPLSAATIAEIVAGLTERVYVSIDLDVFDPALMPAVATPEPGGLGWYEVLRLLRAVAEARRIIGCDFMELAPLEGPVSAHFLAAKLAYKLIGYATR